MTKTTCVVRGGVVIDTDPVAVLGEVDVLVRDGRIAEVGPDLAVGDEVEVIDATGKIVLPGFVDTHRHTWQAGIRAALPDSTLPEYVDRILAGIAPRYRPEDVRVGVLAGALECLDAGITTLLDWSHIMLTPAHSDANVEGLKTSGIRAVLGVCFGGVASGGERLAAEGRRLHDEHGGGDAFSLAVAAMGPEMAAEERVLAEWALARDLGLPVTAHMGVQGAESAERGLAFLERHGLIDHPTTYVHAISYADEALKRIADHGGSVSLSPVSETMLGFGYPPTGRTRAAGLPTSLSGDTVVSGPGDMFSVMRATYMFERAHPGGMSFTTRDVLRMATLEGAEVLGFGDVTGSLGVGKHADLILLRTDTLGMASAQDPIAAVVLSAGTDSVDTVLVGGKVVKRDGQMVHVDVAGVLDELTASAAHVTRPGN